MLELVCTTHGWALGGMFPTEILAWKCLLSVNFYHSANLLLVTQHLLWIFPWGILKPIRADHCRFLLYFSGMPSISVTSLSILGSARWLFWDNCFSHRNCLNHLENEYPEVLTIGSMDGSFLDSILLLCCWNCFVKDFTDAFSPSVSEQSGT